MRPQERMLGETSNAKAKPRPGANQSKDQTNSLNHGTNSSVTEASTVGACPRIRPTARATRIAIDAVMAHP